MVKPLVLWKDACFKPNMEFRTVWKPEPSSWKVDHQSPVLTLGSCFAERTGERLYNCHIPVSVNPWGTLFHPLLMERLMMEALHRQRPELDPFLQEGDRVVSLLYPSWFRAETTEELSAQIQETHTYIADNISAYSYLILTLGTAWVYQHRNSGKLVAACHKAPAREFDKILLKPEEVILSIHNLVRAVRQFQPHIKVILTVSPVRHTRDTIPLNAVSKSVLRYACHELTQDPKVFRYFPAYEILMDDLREYRFYGEDMIHPNSVAEQYIFERFSETFFSESTREINEAIESLQQGLAHKPRVKGSEWTKHLERMLDQIERLEKEYSIRLDRERQKLLQLIEGQQIF